MDLLSNRSQKFFNSTSFLQKYASQLPDMKAFSKEDREGFIDFGVSENRLMVNCFIEKFTEENIWLPQYQYYFNSQGIFPLREELVDFFQEKFVKNNTNVKIRPNDLSICNGASSCFTILSYCVSNQNDYIMIETPYYSAIQFDINCVTDNHVYFVNSKSENNFCATLSDYEDAYENARNEKKIISAIIIVTPGNPIGNFSSKQRVLDLLNFAKQRDLHVIIDEIYGNCVYDKKFEFQSILSFFDEIPDPLRTHFMWSFSKDLCSAGLRCGVIYSQNEFVIQAISKLGLIFSTPYVTQHKLSLLLKDKNWLDSFFEINHERMLKSKKIMTAELLKLNLKILEACSGFFLWVDFRLVFSPTLNPLEITFKKEMMLFDILFKNSLYIVPGQALACKEPGWFRIVFCAEEDVIIEGVNRIRKSIEEFKQIR